MKRTIAFFICLCLLFFTCACGKSAGSSAEQEKLMPEEKNNSTVQAFQPTPGLYRTEDEGAELYIYDCSPSGEIIFELSWIRLGGIGGMAEVNRAQADFSVEYDNHAANGIIRNNGNYVEVVLSACSFFDIGSKSYTFSYIEPIYSEQPFVAGLTGNEDDPHCYFMYFLDDYYAGSVTDYAFLGISADAFCRPGEDYTSLVDLYKIVLANQNPTYLALYCDYINNEILIYEIGVGGTLMQVWKCDINSTANIDLPFLNISATYIGIDKTTLMARANVVGPEQLFYLNSQAETLLFLSNLESVSIYWDSHTQTYYGLLDNRVVFQGTALTTGLRIKDIIGNADSVVEGAMYELLQGGEPSSYSAYLWEIENGYLMITFYNNTSLQFYQQFVHSIAFADDLKYFSCIQ